jgi:tetratricopeptide (TPR) repeat protein
MSVYSAYGGAFFPSVEKPSRSSGFAPRQIKESTMLRDKLPAAALITILLIVATAYNAREPAARNIDAATLLGIDTPFCRQPAGNGITGNLFYQLAAAKTELKPYGQLPKVEQEKAQAADDPPLWNNLGTLSYRITTSKPLTQKYFDQGLRLTYAFNHAEAARAYRKAQRLDPKCAMCYWGEALVLGPNINLPMDAAAVVPAVAATRKAKSLMHRATPRERALINALAARYSANPKAERTKLDAAYADAMAKVAARYPDDANIAVLYAESLMDLSPWDYWEAGGAKPKGRTGDIVATLERVLRAHPDHPGAIHYYIHTVEASTDPKRAEPYADRLVNLVPGAGHLVHMPAHIYYRVGRYQDSLAVNKRAVAVDEAYIAQQRPTGIYPLGYYPHNVHFVQASAQMAGDGKTAIEAADKLAAIVSDDTARTFAIAQPVKVAPYFAHVQFSDPDTALALAPPGTGLPYVEAIWHYARGVALAAKGDAVNAAKEAAAIDRLLQTGDLTNLTDAGIPAKDVLQIASHVVNARIAQHQGDLASAVNRFQQAAALEERLAYMEPPYWYYPVRQSLVATLLMQGDLDGAEQAFRASLNRSPNNGWSLYGLAQVYRKRGDMRSAAAAEQLLSKAWAGNTAQLKLMRL